MDISIVLATYNWPQALERVVKSFLSQQTQASFEVVIADDGSKDDTKHLIDQVKSTSHIPIQHIWQEDQGFQLAKIRNKAVVAAKGEYIIFVDGDCIVPSYFIQRHYELAKTGFFVGGNRILLSENFTQVVLEQKINLADKSLLYWFVKRLSGHCNRLLPLVKRALGSWRESRQKWQGVRGCNIAAWKMDIIAVNGFDESFTGWGYEDSDFIIRLLRAGIKRLDGRYYAPLFHLWHQENSRGQEQENLSRLQQVIDGTHTQAHVGINQYLT
ncbi:glycosyltransferase family 2 protein [Piscirickettsia litoralis]|uniref:Glycosyl transferase family 2 n=1 Tax=Piscirickettsia litoralis TaxID=1891921 RepID=A0ABX3A4X5_9GAMM|nr:glycosyltransferase family 2 protein [Piscirickettsia litoralis]ODN43560.1 hypothetical protein BGC07_12355 [Piscirickettsia litoralis]